MIPDHYYTVPAYWRKHFGKSEFPGVLPDNEGCKVRIGCLRNPPIQISPASEGCSEHAGDPPLTTQAWWGAKIVGGFLAFIFICHLIFG